MQKADRQVYEAILESQAKGEGGALCTVVKAIGSVPRHAGAKMLVRPDGSIIGTIGGGKMESNVIADALDVLDKGEPRIVHYELIDPSSGDPGLCGGQVDIFLEPLVSEATLLVIGCGHVGKTLAELAHWLGWRVAVSDDREEFCNPDHIPDADVYLPIPPAKIVDEFTITSQTYVAGVTRSVPLDVEFVPALLKTPAAYIGVMGSRRRWVTTYKQLLEQGISEEELARVHSPLGIELNAETPEEIAISIMAEIVSLRNGGTNQPMKWLGSADAADEASLAKGD
jgi:xanthine dehydrogenase accessory factor